MADDINSGPTGDTSNTGDADAAEAAEAEGWANALAAEYGDRVPTTTETTTQEVTNDEQTDPETTTTTTTQAPPETTTTTTTVDPNETEEQKTAREKLAADEAANKSAAEANGADGGDESEEDDDSNQARRTARQTAREAQQQLETVTTELIGKLYPDRVTELRDGQDKPIKTIEDVMSYNNPMTRTAEHPEGRNFNEEEAAQWLMNAQKELNETLAAEDKVAAKVAEVQVDMSDQIESVNYTYGELLKSMPELRDQLWAQFSQTVTRDKSGIITAMPLALEDFYETALQPYVKLAESIQVQADEKAEADKQAADLKKKQTRMDRSDIYGHDNTDDGLDDEEKGWGKALGDYYGKR